MKHYPALPHGPLQPIFDGIWFVKGSTKMPMVIPMRISRAMTVIRIPGGDHLLLANSMRLSEKGLSELDRLGKVKHVLRLGGFHGRDDGFYRERYGAKIHALTGQSYSRGLDSKKPEKNYLEPDVWLDEASALPLPDSQLVIVKSSSPPEGLLLLKRDGGVLVTGDSLQNTPGPDEFVNFPAKIMLKRFGFFGPHLVGAGWLQFAQPSAEEVRSLLRLDFEHVLPGHGDPVISGAKEKYRPALSGPLKGCHT